MITKITNKELIQIHKDLINHPPKEYKNELDNSILLDRYWSCEAPIPKSSKEISELLKIPDNRTLKTILWNLYRAEQLDECLGDKHYVAVSLDKSQYIGFSRWGLLKFTYEKVKLTIDELEKNNLIEVHKGFINFEKGIGRMTRIKANEEMLEYFNKYRLTPVYNKPNFPIQIEGNKGNLVKPPNINKFSRLCNKLNRINDNNKKHKWEIDWDQLKKSIQYSISSLLIQNPSQNLISICYSLQITDLFLYSECVLGDTAFELKRLFKKGSFSVYGRFHCPLQSLSKKLGYRQLLKIDGEPVVELDYSATFPSICYAEVGKRLEEDPYVIEGFDRSEIKVVFNCMLNAKSRASAIKASVNQINKDYYYCDNIVSKIEKKHREISHHFYSDTWEWACNVESKIAEIIMIDFTKRKEAILPIHDSFVVRADQEVELERIMNDAWLKVIGFKPMIKKEY